MVPRMPMWLAVRSRSIVLAYGRDMPPDIEVSRDIAASPEAVFTAITDITRMGEWSPETRRAEWNEGFDHAEVGAQYTGHNQNGEKEWSIMATIVELVPSERFFFDCSFRDFVFAKWGYAIEPTDTRPQIDRRNSATASMKSMKFSRWMLCPAPSIR